MERYNNYHKHDMYGNVCSMDVVVKPEDYCKRAKELGHNILFTTNHGMQGNLFESYTLAQAYDLKMVVGAECYYVPDRHEKDKSNRHIILICMTNDGVRELNRIISKSNEDGFYYKPIIDHELLFSLTPENFVITTACIAGIWNDENLIKELKQHFGNNFFLEVQNHNTDSQREVNKTVIEFSKRYNIKIIHANDSHYIYPSDSGYRDLFLKGKGIYYEGEDNFILDYPDYDTIVERYEKQGVLNKNQIKEALTSTLCFDNAEDYNLINTDIKLPSVSDNPNQELKNIINEKWKQLKDSIDKKEWHTYLEAIRYEMDIIEKTNMSNYFLIDYKMAKIAKEKYGGVLTKTGRGSAPSFFITKLLELTDINRLKSPITLFPTRFMSIERILGAKSLPDIDLNTADSEPFIKATKDLLGAENCAWMISWKPLQESSAFRLYCKSIGKNINDYNDIAKDLDKYRDDEYWKPIIEDSNKFVGVVEGISESPCSMLLYDKNVSEEIGLIKTPNGKLCCLLDGYNCDKYKYLKNDYLTVMVWAIIRDTCKLANISIPSINELAELLDDKTFEIYEKGLTCSINQADSNYATGLVTRYKPKSLAEMSAFVAIIRPGCASLLNDFIDRKEYTTGIQELDDVLEDSGHRLIYQESIMKYLIWLGISEPQSYDIIKKIAKKKFKEPELKALKEQLLDGWNKQVGTSDGFEETWQVVEDAAHYSFNASHSLSYAYDSLYGAYLKSHYPLEYYTTALNYYQGDMERTNKLSDELKSFKITLKKPRFRYSLYNYFMDKETNSIYKGVASIKYLNEGSATYLYSLKDDKFDSFTDLLYKINEDRVVNSRQLKILIQLQFFQEFGNNGKLLKIYELFNELANRKTISKNKINDYENYKELIKRYSEKETEKQFSKIDTKAILKEIESTEPDDNIPIKEQMDFELDVLGHINMTYDNIEKNICYVLDIDTKYSPKLTLYSLGTGKEITVKVQKSVYENNIIKKSSIIHINKFEQKYKSIRTENGWEKTSEKEWWIKSYKILNDFSI